MDPAAALAGLDDVQARAATSRAAPLAVVAPAGSGKTRVLTARVAHRIATGDVEPEHVLCVTFTRKAADQLRTRLRTVGVRERIEAGTFHAVAWRQLRDRWSAQGRSAPALLDRIRPFLRDQLEVTAPAELAELGTELAWARARLVRPDAYVEAARGAGRRTRQPAERIAERFAAYEAAKAKRHVVDFDDLLAACASAIEHDPAFAEAQRWRFRHLFVDEFQDVNPLQLRLLEAWRGDRWDVFVVGDTHQSIYGWNGADHRLLDELARRWPALETIHLDRTHRSTPQITAAAASVVRAAGLPHRHPTSSGADGPAPRVREHADEAAEIRGVATELRRRHGPDAAWRDMAVLARTTQQVVDLDRGLAVLGIPTRVRRQAALLDAPGVRAALAQLRRDDRPVLAAAAALTRVDVDDPAVEALLTAAEEQRILDDGLTGRGFAGWAMANLSEDADDADAVTVATIHSAKGLEWPVVHVVGCEDGFLPIASARRRQAREEEARLLYVALTRAERELTVHWARTRPGRTGPRSRARSPFLDGFEDAVAASVVEVEPGRAVPQLATLRSRFPSAPVATDPLRVALQAWRAGRARAARTVPDAVLPDEALEALVASRPTDLAGLARVPGLGASRRARWGEELVAVVHRVDAP